MTKKLLTLEELENFTTEKQFVKCGLCTNNCQLTVHNFAHQKFITGNRCDVPIKKHNKNTIPNLVKYKYERLFNYESLKDAPRGKIGIPRVLNMYEHYPYWHTFFTNLGFEVVVSPHSSKLVYENGMDTIPSETLCYPAKLANGHIKELIDMGIETIFYPSVIFENEEAKTDKNMSCPVVVSYPEVIASNMDQLKGLNFYHPFVSFASCERITENVTRFCNEFLNIKGKEVKIAAQKAYEELISFQEDIEIAGKKALEYARENKLRSVVLAGRPYHIDPEINHGLDTLITSYDMVVLTEDSICNIKENDMNLRVLNQWVYHSRLYEAAHFVGTENDVDLIQLNSFGCGIDAVTTDQVKEILEHHNKIYTLLKIDEGANLGASKIRIRSLKAAVEERDIQEVKINHEEYNYEPVKVEGDLKDYTILAPQMSPIHFDFFEHAVNQEGYNIKILPAVDKGAIELALKYVNNDSCYPALVVIGQMLKAIEMYDLSNTKLALCITQTGGGCRASNYISLLRKALFDAGFKDIPVIAISAGNVKDVNGFTMDLSILKRMMFALSYGDMLLRVTHRMRPYEINAGDTNRLHEEWRAKIFKNIENKSLRQFRRNMKQLVKDFDNIAIDENLVKPRVGIVGEILVKYHPTANNNLVQIIEDNGGEAVIPDIIDFFLYPLVNMSFRSKDIENSFIKHLGAKIAIFAVERFRGVMRKPLSKSKHFDNLHHIGHTADNASKLLSLGNQSGEGWFLTGEMINLIEDNVLNIVCTQPFGCLPNHITGKGMFKALRDNYDNVNLVAIDYDPGASEINQVSRIKLMMSVAERNLANEDS